MAWSSKKSALFSYLALNTTNAVFNHLVNCLKVDRCNWNDFLDLSFEKRWLKYNFLPTHSLDSLENNLKHPDQILQTIEYLARVDVEVVFRDDAFYPATIKIELEEASPPFLFMMGNPECLNHPKCAIVGTRNPSEAGKAAARSYTALMVSQGVTIVSGGARGIDCTAHIAALETGGATVIVIPTGILTCTIEKSLCEYLDPERSLILSVFPPMAGYDNRHAIFRNSIIGALAERVIVPETPLRSGTAYVIRHALKHRRPLYTVIPDEPVPESASGNKSLLSSGAHPLPPTFDDPQKILDTLMRDGTQ